MHVTLEMSNCIHMHVASDMSKGIHMHVALEMPEGIHRHVLLEMSMHVASINAQAYPHVCCYVIFPLRKHNSKLTFIFGVDAGVFF